VRTGVGLESRPVARCTGRVRGVVVFVALLLASCTAPVRETTPDPATSRSSVHPTGVDGMPSPRAPTPSTPSTACPVTLPNGHNPPSQRRPGQTSPFSHGNRRLWVELYPRGIIRPANYGRARPNGTIAVKFPWTRGVTGHLRITGQRLDADAPALQSWVPGGYGRTGFQSSAVIFPATGCWEVTGRVGSASLTVVTKVTGPPPA
jgi:hypothetical protein